MRPVGPSPLRVRTRETRQAGTVPGMDLPDHGLTVFAIGHSTRSLDELVALLRHHGVARVVDVRSLPRSRHNPPFDREALPVDLPERGIAYVHAPGLGGFRHVRLDSVNTGLRHPGFRGYADYMGTDSFGATLDELVRGAVAALPSLTTVMCAEGSPFRCHRRLLADALTVHGVRVLHITSMAEPHVHELSADADWDGHHLTYPSGPSGQDALTLFD